MENFKIELQEMQDIEARYRQGLLYLFGNTVKVDSHKGFELLKQSAEGGYPKASSMVGMLYYRGFLGSDHFIKNRIHIPVKPSEAYNHTKVAAEAGLILAQERMYKIMLDYPDISGLCEKENIAQALLWLKAAADQLSGRVKEKFIATRVTTPKEIAIINRKSV